MRISHPAAEAGLYRVCFVCSGNICRSPVAEVVFEAALVREGLGSAVGVLSAATGGWYAGGPMDPRSLRVLARGGYGEITHTVRAFDTGWFSDLDLVVALDRNNQAEVRRLSSHAADREKTHLLLSFDPAQSAAMDVIDPFFDDDNAFAHMLTTIERACDHLLSWVRRRITG